MRTFQRVTVALALAPGDEEILRHAALVAALGVTREFSFVHVLEGDRRSARIDESARQRLESAVAAGFRAPDGSARVSCHVLYGARFDSLMEFVIAGGSELILLGRCGVAQRSPLAIRLAMVAPCSVWVVPRGSPAQISRILAPVDFSEHSADALSQAAAIGCLTELDSCFCLHVSTNPQRPPGPAAGDDWSLHGIPGFHQFLRSVNSHGVAILPHCVPSSNIAGTIIDFARQSTADLIVMSTRGQGHSAALLPGSTVSRTLLESEIPVLAVTHFGARLNLFQMLHANGEAP